MERANVSIVLFSVLCLWVSPVFGFSTHNGAIFRTFDRVQSEAGGSITVTVRFTNAETSDLRGFYYTEHIPEGLGVDTGSVKINGSAISCLVESGIS